ncbi:MAG: bifunctional molybdopterin-guanine dinucleotide biosynthesis adaptor protein MobB/molybdopterin molybdotransferase MoeA [Methylococcaceae bacterium]|jgi:molybdopterin molybdotransferase
MTHIMLNKNNLTLGFIAASGTGKTSLLEQLIPILKQKGLAVGAIKRSHHDFEIDQPGKDSFRLRAAGATNVVLASKFRRVAISECQPHQEPVLADLIKLLGNKKLDLILVEGFKDTAFPKIELYRTELDNTLQYPNDPNIIAVASNVSLTLPEHIKLLDLNQPALIADFIAAYCMEQAQTDTCFSPSSHLLTLDSALQRIKSACLPLSGNESIPLANALGRVLVKEVTANFNIPTHRQAAMDGYAFMTRDSVTSGFSLELAGTAWAGRPFTGHLKAGQCIRIFTGAVVPDPADCVVMQENCEIQGQSIHFSGDIKLNSNIRAIGDDMMQNQSVLPAPKKLNAVDLGLLASAGVSSVTVSRQIKIAFFSTGDELIGLDQSLSTGKIYDSNRYSLIGLLKESCYAVSDLGVLPDDRNIIHEQLTRAAAQHDVLISTGGASVGDADYIHEILTQYGQADFWKIAIKPGKPLAFGKLDNCFFFGLPGNPIAVITTFKQLVEPALFQLSGAPNKKTLRLPAICTSNLKKAPGRRDFQRGVLSQNEQGELFVESAGKQESHLLTVMSRANCFIVLPEHSGNVQAGDQVWVEPFDIYI